MVDMRVPRLVGGYADSLRFAIGVGDDDVLRAREKWSNDVRVVPSGVALVRFPDFAVALEERLAVRMSSDERCVIAVARREIDAVLVRARKPERRVGSLVGLHVDFGFLPVDLHHGRDARGEEGVQSGAIAFARLFNTL